MSLGLGKTVLNEEILRQLRYDLTTWPVEGQAVKAILK